MSAKSTDLARLQEIYDVITQTCAQIESLSFTRDRFLDPKSDEDDLIAEGILNRVLRVTEEAGRLSDGLSGQYGFDRRGASGVRNRLAHAYGEVNREMIWSVLQDDFPALLEACDRFARDYGVDFE